MEIHFGFSGLNSYPLYIFVLTPGNRSSYSYSLNFCVKIILIFRTYNFTMFPLICVFLKYLCFFYYFWWEIFFRLLTTTIDFFRLSWFCSNTLRTEERKRKEPHFWFELQRTFSFSISRVGKQTEILWDFFPTAVFECRSILMCVKWCPKP